MTLKEFKQHLFKTLENTYPQTEIDSFLRIILEDLLQLTKIDVILKPDFKINANTSIRLKEFVNRLLNEEPIQYILGQTEFFGLPFYVTSDTLIPRPETEELVSWVLQTIKQKPEKNLQILDIGTGTGCIPISIAKHVKGATISAIDVSKNALKIAAKNTELNNVFINYLEQNILKTDKLLQKYDIIISNPPYVRALEKKEMQTNVLDNEPHLALFVSDDNPLLFYKKIADLAKNHLTENGVLFFEINQYLSTETKDMLTQKGFKNIILKKDLFNNYRMLRATL